MAFPPTRNLNSGINPDLALVDSAGKVSILPNGGQTGYRSKIFTSGSWNKMNLVSAVGDVTGDGKGDVLGRMTSTGTRRCTPESATDTCGRPESHRPPRSRRPSQWSPQATGTVTATTTSSRGPTRTAAWLVRGLGNGKFAAPKRLPGSNWARYTSIAATGDLNGNGQPDLVGLHENGHLYFIGGTKQGALAAPRTSATWGRSTPQSWAPAT